ncbi:6-phosphofructokinase [Nitritalea halalkaliphila]|nr:ATP-dependent 6-phosphofructokinase [Nitritalea halalkaliphila]
MIGSMEALTGVLETPPRLMVLDEQRVAGIHVKGGTILQTSNKNNPLAYPVRQPDGSVVYEDRSQALAQRILDMGFDALINIGGDGSQKISLALAKHGVPVVGVPKTIDNDLSGTDVTFGFQTAVQIATESFDRLVSTSESHHRVMIMEVMGRGAGWIALHAALAGGAEACLIPEIPYDVDVLKEHIEKRYDQGRGFACIVVAEGAKPKAGKLTYRENDFGSEHKRLGGLAYTLSAQLKAAGLQAEIRETVLGHVQRGGVPVAYDRVLASLFGVKAFDLVVEGAFGQMVAAKGNEIIATPLENAVSSYHAVQPDSFLVDAARGLGISFGE